MDWEYLAIRDAIVFMKGNTLWGHIFAALNQTPSTSICVSCKARIVPRRTRSTDRGFGISLCPQALDVLGHESIWLVFSLEGLEIHSHGSRSTKKRPVAMMHPSNVRGVRMGSFSKPGRCL